MSTLRKFWYSLASFQSDPWSDVTIPLGIIVGAEVRHLGVLCVQARLELTEEELVSLDGIGVATVGTPLTLLSRIIQHEILPHTRSVEDCLDRLSRWDAWSISVTAPRRLEIKVGEQSIKKTIRNRATRVYRDFMLGGETAVQSEFARPTPRVSTSILPAWMNSGEWSRGIPSQAA